MIENKNLSPLKHSVDMTQMHLQAMLCLIDRQAHLVKLLRAVKLCDRLGIDLEIAQWRFVGSALCKSAAG